MSGSRCLVCGRPIAEHRRADAKTCNGACRIALYRRRHRTPDARLEEWAETGRVIRHDDGTVSLA